MSESTPYVNWDAAIELLRAQDDRITRRLLSRVAGALATHWGRQDLLPETSVDLLFVFRILSEVFAEHESIRAVLDGNPAGEWFEDEA
jgi:hypothetical protein